MRQVVEIFMVPIIGVAAVVYLAAAWWLGADLRYAWFAFPLLLTLALWSRGRAVLAVLGAAYLLGYYELVGFGPLAGGKDAVAAALPAACLLVQVSALFSFWLVEHIKNGT